MTKLVKCTDRFTETTIDDEAVVMDLESGSFFSLSGSALAIWELIDGTRDKAAVLAALRQVYAAPEADLVADVDQFVGDLAAAGLVSGA